MKTIFQLLVAKAGGIAVVGPVDELLARPFLRLTLEVGQQVVAVEMNLECRSGDAWSLSASVGDIGLTGGGDQGRQPVLVGDDLVDLGAGLDDAGPPHHQRHPVAALPVGVLFTAERRRPAVGPAERLGAVVGRPDDDGVLGDVRGRPAS